jgi:endonuclease YncB( thermonuclease family)
MRLLKSENNKNNILALLAVATFTLHLFTLLLLMFHGAMLQQLNRKNADQSLVQLADGSTITVDPQQNLDRNPETIRRFVGETMTLMFTWSQKQPPETVWQISSELLAENLREKFQSEIKNIIPENQFENLTRGTENAFVLQTISQPIKIGDGKWKVEIFANSLMFQSSDKLGKPIPFNKEILVRVIDRQTTLLPNAPQPLNLAVNHLGEAKLEIYNICEIKDKNCSEN